MIIEEIARNDSNIGAIIVPIMVPVSKRVQIEWIEELFNILMMMTVGYPQFLETLDKDE
jgi:hypothetical protein